MEQTKGKQDTLVGGCEGQKTKNNKEGTSIVNVMLMILKMIWMLWMIRTGELGSIYMLEGYSSATRCVPLGGVTTTRPILANFPTRPVVIGKKRELNS